MPAGPGVDLEDGVARVVLPREERVLANAVELRLELRDEARDLALVLAQLAQFLRVLVLRLQALVALELARHPRVLGGDAGRSGLVVPEPRSAHRLLELASTAR